MRGTRKGSCGKHEQNTKTDMQENAIIKPNADKQQIKSQAWSTLKASSSLFSQSGRSKNTRCIVGTLGVRPKV